MSHTLQTTTSEVLTASVERIRHLLKDLAKTVSALADEFRIVAEAHGGADIAIDALHREIPGVDLRFWRSIADVSEKRLHPLAIANGCGNTVSVLKKMPLQEQERALTNGVPVAVGRGDHRLVPAHLLRKTELERAISKDGRVRSIAEQDAHERELREAAQARHEAEMARRREHKASLPDERSDIVGYRITERGNVVITELPFFATVEDLLQIVAEVKATNARK